MPVAGNAVTVTGLREFQAALRAMDAKLPRQLRLVLNDVARIVVEQARPGVPQRSGRARASIRAASGQRDAKVKAGGAGVPYYPWLEFGGAVGKSHGVKRPFVSEGRYLLPAYEERQPDVLEEMQAGLTALARSSGVGVD